MADDKLYKAEYVGSGTFIISKPKRKKTKQRQSNLKNVKRGSRKGFATDAVGSGNFITADHMMYTRKTVSFHQLFLIL